MVNEQFKVGDILEINREAYGLGNENYPDSFTVTRVGVESDIVTYYLTGVNGKEIGFHHGSFAYQRMTKKQNMTDTKRRKSPVSMFNGKYPAGTVFVEYHYNHHLYVPENTMDTIASVPKEVAELWEVATSSNLKAGDWVKVLDTPNVRKYDARAIGHAFQIPDDYEVNSSFTEGGSKGYQAFPVNYRDSDVALLTEEELEAYKLSTFIIGSNSVRVSVTPSGVFCRGERIDPDKLKIYYTRYLQSLSQSSDAGAYTVRIPKNVRCIRFGCSSENHLFSIQEIEDVIEAYDKIKQNVV